MLVLMAEAISDYVAQQKADRVVMMPEVKDVAPSASMVGLGEDAIHGAGSGRARNFECCDMLPAV